jgi:PAS domain S-box-containing protein
MAFRTICAHLLRCFPEFFSAIDIGFPVIGDLGVASVSRTLVNSMILFQGQRPELVWYFGIAAFVVAQGVWIGFLLLEHRRRTRLEAERGRTAAALRESEWRNRAILDAFPDLMFLLDERGVYLDWYANDPRNLYVPPDQFLGKTLREVLPPVVSELCIDALQQVVSSGVPARVEYSLQIDGETRFFETRLVRCRDLKVLSIARDITELKRAETGLQQLSSQLLSLQEEERRRIATELHDTTAQHLFAININLENLRRMGEELSPAGLELLNECRVLCESSLQEVRTLAYLHHPPELERTGLVSAVRWFVEVFRKRTGIAAELQAAPEMARLPLELETDLFRVVQEGLSNVFKHSGSSTATVVLKNNDDHVFLQIRDSGRGMTGGEAPVAVHIPTGVGISIIRQRLRRWGGRLTIESNGEGLLLSVHVPFSAEERALKAGAAFGNSGRVVADH